MAARPTTRTRAGTISRSSWAAVPARYRKALWATLALALLLWMFGHNPIWAVAALCLYLLALDAAWARQHRVKLARADQPAPSLWGMLKAHADEEHRIWYLRKQWPAICQARGLITKGVKAYPDLYKISVDLNGDISCITFPEKMSLDTSVIANNASGIAKSANAVELRVKRIGNDGAALTFVYSDPLKRILPIAALKVATEPQVKRMLAPLDLPGIPVTYGVRSDESPAFFWSNMHRLVGGRTRAGKSSEIWAALGVLLYLRIPVRLFVLDQKGGMEFPELGEAHERWTAERANRRTPALIPHDSDDDQAGPLFEVRGYADNDVEAEKLVTQFRDAMRKRQAALKQSGHRKHTPTRENPLCILVIDEMLADAKLLKNATTGPLGNILSQGAAAGYVVWAGTQLGHAADIGTVRNLIPQRSCFSTPSPDVTNTILGPNAEARGALCSQIGMIPGLGYSMDESEQITKFRAAWVGEADRKRIALGLPPEGLGDVAATQAAKEWAVYQHFYPDGQCAYIGITNDLPRRNTEHALKAWWGDLDHGQRIVQWFDTEAEARQQEQYLIAAKLPKWNRQHNMRNPTRDQPWQPQPKPSRLHRTPKPPQPDELAARRTRQRPTRTTIPTPRTRRRSA